MADLNGTKTHDNLKAAFAGESQANRRYLYFAQKADVEGYPDTAALFRSVAEGETGHAFGHFDFLAEVCDPATGEPVGDTVDNVPGVEKCGPKTAVKWLTAYDSLDGVVANADQVKGKVGENLRAALEFLPILLATQLVAPMRGLSAEGRPCLF